MKKDCHITTNTITQIMKILDLELRNEAGETLDSVTTPASQQKITKHVFEVEKAGTYYIVNPAGGIFVHGFVIAKNK